MYNVVLTKTASSKTIYKTPVTDTVLTQHPYWIKASFKRRIFTCAESNANEKNV